VKENMSKRPSQIAAQRIKELRNRHNWSQQQLADRITELGSPIDRAAIAKLEAGPKQRRLQLDEMFVFAFALDVAPISLVLPTEDEDIHVAGRTEAATATVRSWFVGEQPLGGPDGGQDSRTYFSEVPEREFLSRIQIETVKPKQFVRELAESLPKQKEQEK
jgi:transcriptional regulator with XRE-family HTH domain